MVNNTVYHLLVLTRGLRYFWKRGNIRRGCVEIEDWATSLYFVLGFQENSMQKPVCFLIVFLVIKGILKALFSFIPWLLNFSDLPNYGSNLRKRYSLRLLSKCLVRSTLLPTGVKVPPTLWYLFDSLRWAPFSLAYTYVLAKLLQNGAKFI